MYLSGSFVVVACDDGLALGFASRAGGSALRWAGAFSTQLAPKFQWTLAPDRGRPSPTGFAPQTPRWHQLDDTWLCVDTKDRWGRVFEEQGRILWHAPGAPRVGDGRTAAKQPQSRRALATQGSKQSAASRGCPAIAVVAIGVVLMLPAVAHAAAGFGMQ